METISERRLARGLRDEAKGTLRDEEITQVRLVEDESGLWSTFIKLWNPNKEYLVTVYDTKMPKTYKNLDRLVDHIRDCYLYSGPIVLERRRRDTEDVSSV